ncbi:resolvase (plasmid) [Enterococcus gilvus]|nr:resolvase [Enterococcus gilvus]NBK09904.1 resolvase [Enterococcus asini]
MQKELHFLRKKDIFVIESLERLGRLKIKYFHVDIFVI